eukprot:3802918-Rhodomonas_salina.2
MSTGIMSVSDDHHRRARGPVVLSPTRPGRLNLALAAILTQARTRTPDSEPRRSVNGTGTQAVTQAHECLITTLHPSPSFSRVLCHSQFAIKRRCLSTNQDVCHDSELRQHMLRQHSHISLNCRLQQHPRL